MRFVINGHFLCEPVLGVQRCAREITIQLDKLLSKTEDKVDIQILVPENNDLSVYQSLYKNIEVVAFGNKGRRVWEQFCFSKYLRKTGAKGINLCNSVSLFSKGGIVCVHDIIFKTHPEFFTSLKDQYVKIYRRLMYAHAFGKADRILTDSEFSKREILQNYKLKNPNIVVIGMGWQHYDINDIDESVFDEYKEIVKGKYYYYLASLATNKNLAWVLNNAKSHPEFTYVLSGKQLGDNSGITQLSNIVYTGYVSDAKARALMKYCRAFVFPSKYEGFGIPPMEALCMGAKIVIGDIPCLREVYEDSAYYVDCEDYNCDIEKLLEENKVASPQKILDKYSWEKSAQLLLETIKGLY